MSLEFREAARALLQKSTRLHATGLVLLYAIQQPDRTVSPPLELALQHDLKLLEDAANEMRKVLYPEARSTEITAPQTGAEAH